MAYNSQTEFNASYSGILMIDPPNRAGHYKFIIICALIDGGLTLSVGAQLAITARCLNAIAFHIRQVWLPFRAAGCSGGLARHCDGLEKL